MTSLETRVNAILRFCAAEKESERAEARKEIRRLTSPVKPAAPAYTESLIRQILLNMGAPDHLLGHAYVIEAITLVAEDRTYIRNITFGLYPQIAARFDTTAGRVERAIRSLIEVTWTRGNLEMLEKYFGSTTSPNKGKPTNVEFIARVANVVKLCQPDQPADS